MNPVEEERFQADRVLTLTGGHAIHDTYTAFLPPLLPAFIENLALTRAEAGVLTVFFQLPSLLQPLIGHAADRVNLRFLVILAPGITATMMSLLGVAPSFGVLSLLLVVAGASSAVLHSVASVMAGRLAGRNLGRGMGFWMVGGEIGRTLGPIVIVAALQWLGLKGTPWLMVGGWLATAVLFFRLREAPARSYGAEIVQHWSRPLRAMVAFFAPLLGLIVARAFMSASLATFLPVYLTEEGSGLWFAGMSLAVLEAAGVAGALLGGSLSDSLGRRRMLFISFFGTSVLMFVFLALAGWVRFPLLLLLGLFSLSNTPVIMAMVQESFPESRALANGVYLALSFAIRSGIVVLVGALGDRWGMRLAFTVSAFVPLLGLPFLFFLPKSRPAGV